MSRTKRITVEDLVVNRILSLLNFMAFRYHIYLQQEM